jgi:hypothetical protein
VKGGSVFDEDFGPQVDPFSTRITKSEKNQRFRFTLGIVPLYWADDNFPSRTARFLPVMQALHAKMALMSV